VPHSRRGILGMANKGRHTNGSQFYITLQPAAWMNTKYVAFGYTTSFVFIFLIRLFIFVCNKKITPHDRVLVQSIVNEVCYVQVIVLSLLFHVIKFLELFIGIHAF